MKNSNNLCTTNANISATHTVTAKTSHQNRSKRILLSSDDAGQTYIHKTKTITT